MKRFATLLGLVVALRLGAQQAQGIAQLGELVEGLGTTSRVLMIGAHPDDEDTQLITYLAKARHVETAYLSLTRGDGGQNLIGNELGPALGMIRTEELLAARRIDGGRQYFTRAYDFGFSKTIDETFAHWARDSILEDMVAIVRAFRPHVIIAVFTGTPADGHGHHQFSGVLAREVFDAAADSVRFPPSSVGGLRPWAVSKFYRLRRGLGDAVRMNVGEWDPLVGRSYAEIATDSRSQHRSQGQGAVSQRGPRFDGARLEASRVSRVEGDTTLFASIDTGWSRFKSIALRPQARNALDSLGIAERDVRRRIDLAGASTMVAPLAAYVRLVARAAADISCTAHPAVPDSGRSSCDAATGDFALALESARRRGTQALLTAAAVSVEATAPRALVAEGDSIPVTVSVYNAGKTALAVERVTLISNGGAAQPERRIVFPDSIARQVLTFRADTSPTMAWWLRRPLRDDMFQQPLAEMIAGEDRLQDSGAEATLSIAGTRVVVNTGPVVFRFADRARGEIRRQLATVPEIAVSLEREAEYARADVPLDRRIVVHVANGGANPRDVEVSLVLPSGLRADTAARHVALGPLGHASLDFRVTGRLAAGRHQIVAIAKSHGREFRAGFISIDYEHIRPQRFYRPSTMRIEAVHAAYSNLRVGYVRGVGDNVMPMLEQLGIPVVELDRSALPQLDLSTFTTIVLGPRAYEADSAALLLNTPLLMRFAARGGTIVAQYGQLEMAQPGILPYPISYAGRTADRVTDEHAAVRVLDPRSPLLSAPNAITPADFDGWIQERALYMPRTFDKQYHAILSLNDAGDPPNDAAVLVAHVGKGTYIYTTLSFFRQLPNASPGAARLFINLLAAGQQRALR